MFNLKKRVEMLEKGENEDLKNMVAITNRMIELEKTVEALRENLNLLMEYMGVHLEHINEKCVVEDECICDECCKNDK